MKESFGAREREREKGIKKERATGKKDKERVKLKER
jgi:hypothetical protein